MLLGLEILGIKSEKFDEVLEISEDINNDLEELLYTIKLFSDKLNKEAWLLTNSMNIDLEKKLVDGYKLKNMKKLKKF